jgi:oligopeptide/dipeptide ABC transporter ATP-binding protein
MSETVSNPVPVVAVRDLQKHYRTGQKSVYALNGVSLDVMPGETLGVVGESGCGKTTLAKTLLRLIEPTSGKIIVNGLDITTIPERELRRKRKQMQYVFQSPYTSLNPAMTVGDNIGRGIVIHGLAEDGAVRERVAQILETLNMQPEHLDRFPHEFSGGQRQRIAIARALAVEPELIILDEPTSALDVSVQAQILNLLRHLQEVNGYAYLFITHNLIVAEHMSHRIGIMYLGDLVELAPSRDIFTRPHHPYTEALLSSAPRSHPNEKRERIILEGDIPDPSERIGGCPFHTRCPYRQSRCETEKPFLQAIEPDRLVACHFPRGIPV